MRRRVVVVLVRAVMAEAPTVRQARAVAFRPAEAAHRRLTGTGRVRRIGPRPRLCGGTIGDAAAGIAIRRRSCGVAATAETLSRVDNGRALYAYQYVASAQAEECG